MLAQDPHNSTALLGLYASLLGQERNTQAADLLRQHPELTGKALQDLQEAQAMRLRDQAEAQHQRGDDQGALNTYAQALTLAPHSPWVRLSYARYLSTNQQPQQAQALIEPLTQAGASADALYTAALFALDRQRWDELESYLQRISPQQRNTADIQSLEQRVEVNRRLLAARRAAAGSDPAEAQRTLQRLQDLYPDDFASRGQVALALSDLGQAKAALQRVQEDLAKDRGQSRTRAYFAHAIVLTKTGHLADAQHLVERLEQRPNLRPEDRRSLQDIRNAMAVAQADRQRTSGDLAGAYDSLQERLSTTPNDLDLLLALGRLYQTGNQSAAALMVYDSVLQQAPENPDAVRGAVEAALSAGDPEGAMWRLQQAGSHLDQPTRLLLRARVAEAHGQNRSAIALLVAAQQSQAGSLAETERLPVTVTEPVTAPKASPNDLLPAENPFRLRKNTLQALITAATHQTGGEVAPDAVAYSLASDIEKRLAALQNATEPRLHISGYQRSREGTKGKSELTEHQLRVQLSWVPAEHARWELNITPTDLNASNLKSNKQQRFGTTPLVEAYNGNAVSHYRIRSQQDSGIGLNMAYQTQDLRADFGTTPLGFEITHLIGGLNWRPKIGAHSQLSLGVERRAVTDSLLSYAGTKDPRTGKRWGGVTRNQVQIQYSYDDGASGVYLGSNAALYRGEHVENNHSFGADAGAYLRPLRTVQHELQTGISLYWMNYHKNLGDFTLGHGGYFSPQSFFGASLPVQYSFHNNDWELHLNASLGWQTFHQNSVDYFPGTSLQGDLQRLAQTNPAIQTRYKAHHENGVAFNGGAHLEYKLTEQTRLGGTFTYNSFGQYNENTGLLYFRHTLKNLP